MRTTGPERAGGPLRLAEPLALLDGKAAADAVAAGRAHWLAGGPAAFALLRLDDTILPAVGAPPEILRALTAPVPHWAGLPNGAVMGILNLTPDSFSDGGQFTSTAHAIDTALAMTEAGAALIDVGGESTRPGAAAVTPEQERARVLPVIRALADRGILVSIDTRNASTMQAALDAGARIVNDVSALTHDQAAAHIVARASCPVVLMHMRHDPTDMTRLARYDDVAREVATELAARIAVAVAAGIARHNIAIDPGIGFAKTAEHNLLLLPRLAMLLSLGCRIVIGLSRKGFIGRLSGVTDPKHRLAGSISAGLHALSHGAAILRVHDVAETVQAVRVWRGLA